MTIADYTTREVREQPDLADLVEANEHATPEDETHWIERKSDVDLTPIRGADQVPKVILGLANRMPDLAGAVCEAVVYSIVGAIPGRCLVQRTSS